MRNKKLRKGAFFVMKKYCTFVQCFNFKIAAMANLIKDILLSPLGSFASVFALFALAFWLVHWITKKVTLIESSHKSICEDNQKINSKIDHYSERQDKHMDEIRRDIAVLKAMSDIYKMNFPQSVAKSNSPISLTDIGKEVAIQLGADEVIAKNWDKIVIDIEQNVGNKNAYDIQQYCMETSMVELEKFLDPDTIDAIKNIAFKEGRPMAYYAPIFGIKIRDKYLTAKGIPIEDIDKSKTLA